MSEPHEDIRTWLRSQHDWLQHAAEMVLKSGSVSDDEIAALTERLKTLKGQMPSAGRTFEGLGVSTLPATALRLESIGEITGIENLEPRAPLTFGTGNLCVIYGHNGSGKSGYTRLLKRACGKPGTADLKHNVFKPLPSARKCKIGYRLSDTAIEVEWRANAAPVEDLRPVDIFDSEVASSYLTEEAAATYTPPAVTLFEELATICDRVKARLQREQALLVRALPELPPAYTGTKAAKVYLSLKPNAEDPEIRAILNWTTEDKTKLEQITVRLKEDDPAALARAKRQTMTQLDQIVSQLTQASTLMGGDNLALIRQLRSNAETRRKIAAEAGHLESAKLEGVGTETWQAMWEAAREYSQQGAYPDREYPVTEDARCVLCHQELAEDAKVRLKAFEVFVQGTLVADAEAAKEAYDSAIEKLPAPPSDEMLATQCQAADVAEEQCLEAIQTFWGQVAKCRAALVAGETKDVAQPVSLQSRVVAEFKARSGRLALEADQHDKDAATFDRSTVEKEKLELEARQWTAQQSNAVLAEVARLLQVDVYELLKRAANSRDISLKSGEVSKTLVTQAYVNRFNRELKALGASKIRVELVKTRIDHGRVLHKLQLKDVLGGTDQPSRVLSEGERRIVSLAAFLADVADHPHAVPFVFDDPISSLDHDFEWHVAVRLAQLAQARQVLVFTHRLSLYGAMEEAAKKEGGAWKDENLQLGCIERYSGAAGQPANQEAWNASTKTANNLLLDRLKEAKKAGDLGGKAAYAALAQGICSDYRKLLERTVENDLLNEVVKRHRRSVTTDNRIVKLSKITSDDCKLFDDLMTKYSCYEHSQSTEIPTFIPEEPELRQDLETLKAWRESFKKR